MKRLGILLTLTTLVLLSACNIPRAPGPDQQTQTFEAAGTQTQTAAPALVQTLTPTGTGPALVTATPLPQVRLTPSPTQFTAPQSDAVVATTNLRLRSGPSTAFPVIRQMPSGTQLTVTGKNGSFSTGSQQLWLSVVTPDGARGWAAGWLMTINVSLGNVPVVATPIPPTPVPSATPTITYTPVPTGPVIKFWADHENIPPGTCTTIHWETANIQAVFFENQGVAGNEARTVCPGASKSFYLHVIKQDGSEEYKKVTVLVGGEPIIDFRADAATVKAGECTTVRWDVEGVQAVFFQNQGVPGHSEANVCPGGDTQYHLQVITSDGSRTIDKYLEVKVE